MIVHMTELYTRLVTYAKLHIFTLMGSFYHDTCYISFITLFFILVILLSFILVIMLLLLILFLCTSTFSFTHTLTRSLSDDSEFVRPDIGRFVSIIQVFDETVFFAKSWSFSLFDSSILILSYFPVIFLFSIYVLDSVFIPVLVI